MINILPVADVSLRELSLENSLALTEIDVVKQLTGKSEGKKRKVIQSNAVFFMLTF